MSLQDIDTRIKLPLCDSKREFTIFITMQGLLNVFKLRDKSYILNSSDNST